MSSDRKSHMGFNTPTITHALVIGAALVYSAWNVFDSIQQNPDKFQQFEQAAVDHCTGVFGCGAVDLLVVSAVVVVLSLIVVQLLSVAGWRTADE